LLCTLWVRDNGIGFDIKHHDTIFDIVQRLNITKKVEAPSLSAKTVDTYRKRLMEKLVNFLRMERWIFDSPDQAGEAWRQFIKEMYQNNSLIHGTLELDGSRVDLKKIKIPVLNVFAEQDHLVPPESSKALGQYLGTDDYTVKSFPVGHIGMYVSGEVQKSLPPTIADWLKKRL
jgi:class III poly(R)-hydroxyalkanoic acid synthase PhaC subunit